MRRLHVPQNQNITFSIPILTTGITECTLIAIGKSGYKLDLANANGNISIEGVGPRESDQSPPGLRRCSVDFALRPVTLEGRGFEPRRPCQSKSLTSRHFGGFVFSVVALDSCDSGPARIRRPAVHCC